MSYNKVILIGYSGHGYVVAEVAIENQCEIIGYTDKLEANKNPYNLEYMGFEFDSNFAGWKNNSDYIIGVGDNKIRHKIYNNILDNDKKVKTLISSSALISRTAEIGNGAFINKNVSVNALANIGNNVILNTACIIEHGCEIADSVHVAPGAVLAGDVSVGKKTFIGANSFIKQGVKIGENVIVGAGAIVLKDIPDNKKVIGINNKYI